jgi:acetyl-CoA/propionyl-CoA carboxylase, biotin carboxylase, biotin carboxyl carrier protein
MFDKVLIANRGEIAVRVIRTLRAMGIRSVAVYSDADAGSRHVREADEAVHIGAAAARESYLNIERVIAAATTTGAQAVHPGYGFLSENSAFSAACAAAGIVFIGPPAAAITTMGDKINARRTVSAAGVPVVPGCDTPGLDDAALAAAAIDVGFPVLIKPSAGGGGKGMHIVRSAAELDVAIATARREAASAFGDDSLFVERLIEQPRHIEIQVLADTHGNVLHFGERECSLQRRHQKVIEEAPSPLIGPALRSRMGAQAVAVAQACGYVGAGTVEMIVSSQRPDQFFFLEMNTRLQVEHPVTEMVYGVDLVEWQVRVAAGEQLPWKQHELVPRGHSIEARVYAEDPASGFLPTGGTVDSLSEPNDARVDSGISIGSVIGSDYDPMLAKVIVHAPDRLGAIQRLDAALATYCVGGITTNTAFLRRLITHPDVVAGHLDTTLIDRKLGELTAAPDAYPTPRAWGDRTGWRHSSGGHRSAAKSAGSPARSTRSRAKNGRANSGEIRSPMPGTVIAVHVAIGDQVGADQIVVVVEAMKMEHTLRASRSGEVTAVHVSAGHKVALDELLVSIS